MSDSNGSFRDRRSFSAKSGHPFGIQIWVEMLSAVSVQRLPANTSSTNGTRIPTTPLATSFTSAMPLVGVWEMGGPSVSGVRGRSRQPYGQLTPVEVVGIQIKVEE